MSCDLFTLTPSTTAIANASAYVGPNLATGTSKVAVADDRGQFALPARMGESSYDATMSQFKSSSICPNNPYSGSSRLCTYTYTSRAGDVSFGTTSSNRATCPSTYDLNINSTVPEVAVARDPALTATTATTAVTGTQIYHHHHHGNQPVRGGCHYLPYDEYTTYYQTTSLGSTIPRSKVAVDISL